MSQNKSGYCAKLKTTWLRKQITTHLVLGVKLGAKYPKLIEKRLVEALILTFALNINRPHQMNAILERIITIDNNCEFLIANFNFEFQLRNSITNLNSEQK